MNPLSALYGTGINARNRLYDRGTFRAHRLKAPVVSIGSISAGGAGKTPFLIMLGELLERRGLACNVLSRGYGRKTKGVMLVDPEGSPQEYGDEPLLIARKLGVPVIVGEDRYEAGRFAEEKFGLQAHLLDDGFQHRGLARDFDIVLVTQHDLHDTLLPIGRLREPLSSLTRASAMVFMDGASSDGIPVRGDQYVWRASRSIIPPETHEVCFAFCGIARPESFFTELGKTGLCVAGTRAFPDHHGYTERDVQSLFKRAQESGARAFVTTEKDAVNLGDNINRLRPLHVAAVRMQFEHPAEGVAGGADSAASMMEVLYGVIARQNETRVRE